MVASLHSRFAENEDSAVMKALGNLFNPHHSSVGSDIDTVSDYLGKVGLEGRRNELLRFVYYYRALGSDPSNQTVTYSTSCANLAINNKSSYPAAAVAAQRFLILPVSTADCERVFSKQNLIKTSLRNCLSLPSLDNALKMSIDGHSLHTFPYKRAFRLWSTSKSRRIMK
jgi:hypothetical protein